MASRDVRRRARGDRTAGGSGRAARCERRRPRHVSGYGQRQRARGGVRLPSPRGARMLNLSSPPEPGPDLQLAQPRWALKARAEVLDEPMIVAPVIIRQAGQTRAFANVLGSVRHGLAQGDRLIVVTGDSATGKTMLCRALMEEADPRTRMSVMLQPPATAEDLLAHFLRDVGVLDNGTSAVLMSRNSLLFALQRFLGSL